MCRARDYIRIQIHVCIESRERKKTVYLIFLFYLALLVWTRVRIFFPSSFLDCSISFIFFVCVFVCNNCTYICHFGGGGVGNGVAEKFVYTTIWILVNIMMSSRHFCVCMVCVWTYRVLFSASVKMSYTNTFIRMYIYTYVYVYTWGYWAVWCVCAFVCVCVCV